MRKLAVLLLALLFATAAFAQFEDFALQLDDSYEPRTIVINSSAPPPAPKIIPASAPAPRPAVSAPATPAPDLFATLAQGLADTAPQQAPAKPAPAEQQLQQFLLDSLTQGLAEKLVDPVPFITPEGEGKAYFVNDTVAIRANLTNINIRDNIAADILLPNGTVLTINLINISNKFLVGTVYEKNFSVLQQRGRFNVTIKTLDIFGNARAQRQTFFVRNAFNVIDPMDAQGNLLNLTTQVFSNVSGVLGLNITLQHQPIRNILIFNHSEASPFSGFRIGNQTGEASFPAEGQFALDVSGLNFTLLNVTRTATQADILYKCVDFNLALGECIDRCATNESDDVCPLQPAGPWVEFIRIPPGKNYTFLLTNATDPGFAEFNASQQEGEQSTNSTAPVVAVLLNFTPNITSQWLLLGYGELQSNDRVSDVRSRLVLNGSLDIGNLSWQPETSKTSHPPGDYQPFFSHLLRNITNVNLQQNLSVEFFSETSSNITYVRRARAIALRVNNTDAVSNETNGNFRQLTPAGTFHSVINLSYRPPVNQTLLVLASAEVTPNSTTNSVLARLLHNGTERALAEIEGEVVTDIDLFATHIILNATANVTQNFTIQGQSETAGNKSIRRARITVVPLDRAFFNASEGNSNTTATVEQNKTILTFNLTNATEALIIGTADVNTSNITNGRFVVANLVVDGASQGNMSIGSSDATDDFSFIAIHQMALDSGTHTVKLTFFNMNNGNMVAMRRARVSVIPLPSEPVTGITRCKVAINTTTNLTRSLSTKLNNSDACITFGNDSIVLDCKGFSITGNRTGIGILVDGQNVQTLGDRDVQRLERNETRGFRYPVELTEMFAANRNVTADIFTIYGEAADIQDRAIAAQVRVNLAGADDQCELELKRLTYIERTQRFGVTLANPSEVDCYASISLLEVVVDDVPQILTYPDTALVRAGDTETFPIKQRMTPVDLEDNPDVHVRAFYGEEDGLLFKIIDERRPIEKPVDYALLLTVGIIAILIILIIVLFILWRRSKKDGGQRRLEPAYGSRQEWRRGY